MSDEPWRWGGGDIEQAVAEIAATGSGALLFVRHDATGGEGEPELRRAFDLVAAGFDHAVGRRTMWREACFAVCGERSGLEDQARRLLASLSDGCELTWHLVLVEILPRDAHATLSCDFDYGVAETEGSAAFWVTPAPSSNQGASRSPVTLVIGTGERVMSDPDPRRRSG